MRKLLPLILILLLVTPIGVTHAQDKWVSNCENSQCSSIAYKRMTQDEKNTKNLTFRANLFVISPNDYISVSAVWDIGFFRTLRTDEPAVAYNIDSEDLVIETDSHITNNPDYIYMVMEGAKYHPDKCILSVCYFTDSQIYSRVVDLLNGSGKSISVYRSYSNTEDKLLVKPTSKGFTAIYAKTKNSKKSDSTKKKFTAEDAKNIVAANLKPDNRYSVTRDDLKVVGNSLGEGYFISLNPKRSRPIAWFAHKGKVMNVNGATHHLSPTLPFPLAVESQLAGKLIDFWEGTGLHRNNLIEEGLKQTSQ